MVGTKQKAKNKKTLALGRVERRCMLVRRLLCRAVKKKTKNLGAGEGREVLHASEAVARKG